MRFDVNQTTLEVVERGSGHPVLFLHAEFSDLRAWEGQLEPLAAEFRVITYSRRHYHPNPAPPETWDNSVGPHVDDLAELMKSLKIERADIVGLSSGGLISLHFATKHPELVRRLVVCEPDVTSLFIPYEPKPTEIMRLLFKHPVGGMSTLMSALRGVWPAQKLFDRADYAGGVKTFMNGTIGRRYFDRFSPARFEQMIANAPSSARYFARGASKSAYTLAELQRITAPTLSVCGQDSPHMQKMYAKTIQANIARARLAVIPGAAHFVNEHNPPAFNAALSEFLSE